MVKMCPNPRNLLIFVFYCVLSIFAKSPSIFQTCKKSDPKFDSCLMTAIENGAKSIQFGLTNFNIPRIDPAHYKTLRIEAGSGAVGLVQQYSNTYLSGFVGNMIVKQAHFDWHRKLLTFTSFHPIVEQIGYYNFSGELLFRPVHGKGKYFIKFYDLTATTEIQFKEVKRGNDTFFDVSRFSLSFLPKNCRIHFDNGIPVSKVFGFDLFDGQDDFQAKQLNQELNEKWQELFVDVKTKYEAAYVEPYRKALQKIVTKIPVKDLFPQ